MSTTLKNSIWPNADGVLGENKVAIPDGVTTKWPDGDALVGNFVYKDGKLVGFVDTKALINNETKSTTIPYDCVNINLDNILEDTLTIIPGERCKSLTTVYGDVVKFLTPKVKELLGETKFELYFENDTKKLIIHTDRISDDMVTNLENLLSEVLPQTIETEKYNHNIEVSWRDIDKYAECVTQNDMIAVNPNYLNDVTSDGEWVYPLHKIKNAHSLFLNNNSIVTLYLYMNECTNAQSMIEEWWGNKNLKRVYGYCPKLTNALGMFQYRAGLFDVDLKVSALESASWMFSQCILNKESVIRFVDSIPSYTSGNHPLTIGIHIDHKNDEEVLAAITNAEAKGWTLTVQWNGTPTSATSTFNMGMLIYAKVGELEHPDGTTEQYLDWGHYVTNWEERGYEQFRSLESAYEYFGLEMNN